MSAIKNKPCCDKCGTPLSCGSCKAKKAARSQRFTKEQRAEWGRRGGRGKKKLGVMTPQSAPPA